MRNGVERINYGKENYARSAVPGTEIGGCNGSR